ncbi:MAG: class I SAM-dependent methyltransferase [Pseudomonadota bacterium]
MADVNTSDRFAEYWSRKKDSAHTPRPKVNVFRIAASELSGFLDPSVHRKILEIGCGAGEVFEHLNIDRTRYLGIDFSRTVLAEFGKRHPDVRLALGELSTYRSPEQFDFIIVNNVIQYCSPADTLRALTNLKAMLSPDGFMFLGNIPDQRFRFAYETGVFSQDPSWGVLPLLQGLKGVLKILAGRKTGVGFWYRRRDVRSWCKNLGLDTQFFGSLLYPYRFSCLAFHAANTPSET